MYNIALEIVVSPSAGTDSSFGEVALVMQSPLYPNPLAEIVVGNKGDEECCSEVLGGDR